MMQGGRNDRDRRRREEEFVQGVLGQTSGSACNRAANQLPGLADGELAALDRQLITAHLEHCGQCRALAVTLGWLEPLLPQMAEIDPGPAFTRRVLQKTSLAAPGMSAGPIIEPGGFGPAGWMDRLGRWWGERILRPIFPMQVAYVATVVLILLTSTPISPLRGTPGRVLETMRAGSGPLPVFGPVVGAAGESAGLWITQRVDATGGHIVRVVRGVTDQWNRRIERSAPARNRLNESIRDCAKQLRQGQLSDAGHFVPQIGHAAGESWRQWRGREASPQNESEANVNPRSMDRERSTP